MPTSCADIDTVGAHRVAGDIDGEAVDLDVSDPDACARVLGTVGDRIDILVNNAGSYHEAGSILDQSVESWQRSIELNLASLFNCSKPVAARMVDQGDGGAMVNIASVDGLLPCLGTGLRLGKGRGHPLLQEPCGRPRTPPHPCQCSQSRCRSGTDARQDARR